MRRVSLPHTPEPRWIAGWKYKPTNAPRPRSKPKSPSFQDHFCSLVKLDWIAFSQHSSRLDCEIEAPVMVSNSDTITEIAKQERKVSAPPSSP
jgi:hypothetical protein